ncbi:response regulator [Geobacter sp.]|uniref:ATP-binding response regulator n=1 Tax=Geobacter sp. TaxID=46610 RepID=UPI001ACC838A|nr:response regulator [Geobacter sp.]CAG0985614.1 two-component system, OmpR family, phosphate regulon sensor histidine kinase PhoR [Geobacteraceae bacterium]
MTSTVEGQALLLVDDDRGVLRTLAATLRTIGYSVTPTASPLEAVTLLKANPYHTLVTDIMMQEMSGLDLLVEARQIDPDLPVILMTGYAEIDTAIRAIKRGAFDFITKPIDFEYFSLTVGKAIRHRTAIQIQRDYKAALEEMVRVRTLKLTESMEELRIAKERAEDALRVKSRFISTMSHEIRTPVNGIVGMIELAQETGCQGEQSAYLDYAREAALRLTRVMDSILTYSRICGESPDVMAGTFNPREECDRIAQDVSAECRKKGLSCTWDVSDAVPPIVAGDREGFGEILRQLADNAIKFTPSGSVSLEVSVRLKADESVLLAIAVADTGIGVPEAWRARIFEPFCQVDGSLTRQYEGTGLGLSIVKRCAELAGGEVWVESGAAGGAVFLCTLWVKDVSPENR